MKLSIHLCFPLIWVAYIYVLDYELIVSGPMSFNNWNSYFIFQNKKKGGKREKSCKKKQEKKGEKVNKPQNKG